MSRRSVLLVIVSLGGCVSPQQYLDNMQPTAMQTVLNRTRFDWNCPTATGTVISKEMVQPALQGPYLGGIQRAEYTIGVAGCGRRATFIAICPEGGTGCYATGEGPFHLNW